MNTPTLTWLGQSGFILQSSEIVIACDLYLSDFCKRKSRLDHTRLMPIPIAPEKLGAIDHYLITHNHIDHFDPETVGPILTARPSARFYCPPVGATVIKQYFSGSGNRFRLINSQMEYELAPGVRLIALPAAHEELEMDASGEYIALSYLLLLDKSCKAVLFAGDTIPFAGQGSLIRKYTPSGYSLTMVLPVNGRDAERAQLGFKGNLTLEEAIQLYKECQADLLIPCHFGMFALNDLRVPLSDQQFADKGCHAIIPLLNKSISL